MKPTRNSFEMKAHDIQYKKRDTKEAELGENLVPSFDLYPDWVDAVLVTACVSLTTLIIIKHFI